MVADFEPPKTLHELLSRTAQNYPQGGLDLYDNGISAEPAHLSYFKLLRQSGQNGQKLLDQGLAQRGHVVLLYFETHYLNVLWTWSIISAGAVPAILSPVSHDIKARAGQLENLHTLFGNPTILTTAEFAGKFKENPHLNVALIQDITAAIPQSLHNGQLAAPETDEESLAVILFTSGSTGHSKGVEFTHKQLIASCLAKQKMHNLSDQNKFLAWNSFDHSANFCELHLNAMNVGANQVMVPAATFVQRPQDFFLALSKYKIAYSFAANFFLSAAVEALRCETDPEYETLDLSNMRVLMVGGEANRTDVIAKADAVFTFFNGPPNSVKAAYGLSETCSACFYNLESPTYDLEHNNVFASVGNHLPIGMELRIVENFESINPLANGETGQIQLRGDIIFKRYYNNAEATSSCMTADGWFDTGDLGYRDTAGNLVISGRRKEILILNGNNYSSFELEHAIQSAGIRGITPSYVASFSSWGEKSEGIVILFNPTDETACDSIQVRKTIHQINKACVSFCSSFPLAVVPLPRSEMPKSTIGKLSRHKLKQLYEKGVFDRYKLAEQTSESKKAFETLRQRAIAHVLSDHTSRPVEDMGPDTSIMHAGIDSLVYLRVKHDLEKRLKLTTAIPLPVLLASDTIRDLDNEIGSVLTESSKALGTYKPVVILRKTGKAVPLWLLHPGGGEVLNWLNLVSKLDGRPIYAIRARGLQAGEVPIPSLEEMLDTYEKAILETQPNGPYAIFGLCFGGMLAFELTKRLENAGRTVLFCGGIDNPPRLQQMEPGKSFKRFLLQLLSFHGLFSLDESLRLEREDYRDFPDDPELFLDDVMEKFSERATEVDLDRAKIDRWCKVLYSTVDMVNRYRPKGKVNRLVLWFPVKCIRRSRDTD